jgi:MFS family permease
MAIYSLAIAGASYFGPVISGFISQYAGYIWVFYIPAMFLAVVFIVLFFAMEETNYVRQYSGTTTPEDSESISLDGTPDIATGKQSSTSRVVPATRVMSAVVGQVHRPKKSYWQKMSLWTPTPGPSIPQSALRSLQFLGWPVILYSGFSYGSYLIWSNMLNGTISLILTKPPYNFSTSQVGLSYLSGCLGVLLGGLAFGKVSDWLALKLARRNNGIMEPEHRLWPFCVTMVLVPAALILWGVGAAHRKSQ